jgi:uncharacterized protein with HEPN domain
MTGAPRPMKLGTIRSRRRRFHCANVGLDSGARQARVYWIQTISEAVRQIPDDWLANFPTEPWGQIKSIGNCIRPEYFRLDDAIFWEIITADTHALNTVMESMLARHAGEGA